MLTETDFEQWSVNRGLPEPTVQLIKRIRESEPSRNVGGRRGNVTGAYPSKKMGKSIQFESHKVELPGIYLKEHDKNVLEYYNQPPQIRISFISLREKLITIYHTPDFFVIRDDGAGWEEWKTEEELQKLAVDCPGRYTQIDGEWHCPPGEEYAKKFGLHYWVKSSAEINWVFYRNTVFLEDYLLDNKTEISSADKESVLLCVRNNPGINLQELKDAVNVDASTIYYLIARNNIYVNLKQGLLIEPQYTRAFVDEQNALAFFTLSHEANMPKFADHAINIEPGTNITWDGNPWRIMNVGDKYISIHNADTGLIEILKEQFFNSVREKRIQVLKSDLEKTINEELTSMLLSANGNELKVANRRYEIISPLLNGSKVENYSDECGVPQRTLRCWLKSYREAEQRYGAGYIGLIPAVNKRGNRNMRIPDTTLEFINEFLDRNENPINQSIKLLYGKVCNECHEKGIDPPCRKTFGKIISSRPMCKRLFKTQGSRVAYQHDDFYWNLEFTTPRHGERPFEIAHIDHTQVDLEIVHSRTGKNLGKPWLSIMMDAYSRKVLAFYITLDSPSYQSNMMLIRECVRRFERLPQIIVTDNGKDFKSAYFQSLLSFCRVTYKLRPPHEARFGSVMERIFGVTTSQIIHNLQGNTKIMKNVRQVTKSVNPKNYAVWTLPAFYNLLEEYLYEFYDTQEHPALFQSPREEFEYGNVIAGKRDFRYIPYNQDFILLTLPMSKQNNGTALVDRQDGVMVHYIYYQCDEFRRPDVAGTRVEVRYDPWNVGIVYCFIKGKWVKCYSEYYPILRGKSKNEIDIATQELNKQIKMHAKNAKVSAKKLAEFITKAEQTEEMLNQRLYDEEMAPQLIKINGGLDRGMNIGLKASSGNRLDLIFDKVDTSKLDFSSDDF